MKNKIEFINQSALLPNKARMEQTQFERKYAGSLIE